MIANENFEDWTATFSDISGNVISGRFENPMINNTLGYVHTTLVSKGTAGPLA